MRYTNPEVENNYVRSKSRFLIVQTHSIYIRDQHDSTINRQTVYTVTTQTDCMRIVTTK
jgi:hypothetical protein